MRSLHGLYRGIGFLSTLLVFGAVAGPASALNVRRIDGRTEIKRSGRTEWRPVDDSTSVREGDTLRTGPKGKAELRMSEGHRLSVREKTTVTVVSGGKGLQYQFRVISGRVRAFVRKLAAKSRFEIRTPLAVAAVRGTEFEMEVLDRGTSRLSVIEGVVSFKDLDGLFNEVSVVKGQSVTIEPNQAPKPPEPVPQDILKEKPAEAAVSPPGPPKEEIEREAGLDGDRDFRQEQGANNLKEGVYQEGKALIDAYGKRVRLEEYVLRPTATQFAFVAVSRRDHRTDATRLDIFAQNPLPDVVDVKGLFYQEGNSNMINWAVATQRIATNGGDWVKEWRSDGTPVSYTVTSPLGAHEFSQVVFAHWFVEAKAEGQEPVLLSHWIPTSAFQLGNYEATKIRDENDLASDGAQDLPWGYKDFVGVGAGGVVGDDRLIDGFSAAQRAQYFTNATINTKYNSSEGFVRTARLFLDGAPAPFTPAQFQAARETVVTLNFVNPLAATNPDLTQTSFRLTDDGRRLNQFDIAQGNLKNDINFQSVFNSNLFQGRKIDLVTSPLTFRPPDERRQDQ